MSLKLLRLVHWFYDPERSAWMGFAKHAAILAGFLVMASASAFAAPTKDFTKVTETELASALQKYQKIAQLNVQFKQTKTLKDMDIALASQGDLQWKLPDQVIYRITKPSSLKVTMTPKTIEIENGTGAAATKQTIETSSMPGDAEKRSLQAMVTWLKMDPVLLGKEYDITTNHASEFRFVPREPKNSPFSQLDLQLDNSGHVKKMEMSEKSGDHIEFTFEKPKIVYAEKSK